MGDCLWGKGARRRLAAEEGVELAGFFMDPGGLNLGLPGVFALSPCTALRACFLTVPGGFASIVSARALGRRCFLPDNSPRLGSDSSQEGDCGVSSFSSSPNNDPHKPLSLPSRNRAASNDECRADADPVSES